MGASDPETDEVQPDEQLVAEYPWMTVNATERGEIHVQWGYVSEGEWVAIEGEATVGYGLAADQLMVAVQWYQQRWNELTQRAMQQQAAEQREEDLPEA